ncbi:MAG TPA: sigma-70 family RNA polymerase sigma factor [Ktedonobacteraceae bacterium]|nr:sigma-70 family RNA polymerase sigma factor [Ktedonobacteraceae bacterium]
MSKLVITAQQGDLDAFSDIVGRFQAMAYASAYAMVNDAQLAEDVAQEAFIEAFVNLPKLREPAAFPGWFRHILFKQGDRLTRRKHLATAPIEQAMNVALSELNPATLIEQREIGEVVRRAIDTLPEHERIVTLLFYGTGYALKDIAAFLELPPTTVKKRLYDARQHLKAQLFEIVRDTLWHPSLPDESFPTKVQLLIAVRTGNMAKVRAMLDKHPLLVNAKGERYARWTWISTGLTPLYEAAINNDSAMATLLLDYGAVIHMRPYDALRGAVQYQRGDIVELLLAHGANADARPQHVSSSEPFTVWGPTPLSLAAMKGYTEIAATLLTHRATVNAPGPTGRTPLHWAALKGHLDIVHLLLEYGADISIRDELSYTAIDWARERGQLEVLACLEYRRVERQPSQIIHNERIRS